MKYKALVFDLDDTLLDTSQLLIPSAARQACEGMISLGLHATVDQCLGMRRDLAQECSHPEIFSRIAAKYGCDQPELAVARAVQEFYNPRLPDNLPLMPGALENLKGLSEKYELFLVTMGIEKAQREKVSALKIDSFFKKIYIINNVLGHLKQRAFEDILATTHYKPQEILSIGNRLSSEIRDAKRCGCDTCYFAYGEHLGENEYFPEDKPDFKISSHGELISTCAL